MRTAVLAEVNQPLEIQEVEVDLPGPREVLIRTAAAGVCHSDLHFQDGKSPCACPTILGHEGAGIVEAVGEDVCYVAPGDHVITCVSMSCGECRQCMRGRPHLCAHDGLIRGEADAPRLTRSGELVHQFMELLGEKKLQGSAMGSNRFRLDKPTYANLYLLGRLKLDELVSRWLTLDQINDGFDALKTGEVARSVLRMGD